MMFVLVLGMHRSGTSCLAHSLHEAGLSLGTDLMNDVARDNMEGHWENLEAVRINDQILALSGGAWDRVPQTLRTDEVTDRRITAFLEGFGNAGIAGWKDPRTTLTYPIWKPHLGEHRIIAAFRHPASVARSLHVRDTWRLEQGLRLWADYNERLLEHATGDDVLWFDFDAPADILARNVRTICDALGLNCLPKVEQTFNPFLRHHCEPEPIADERIERLYAELRRRAARQHAKAAAGGRVAAPDNPIAAAEIAPATDVTKPAPPAPVADPLRQMARVQELQNVVQQRLHGELARLAHRAGENTQILETVQVVLSGLQPLREHVGQLEAVLQQQNAALDGVQAHVAHLSPLMETVESLRGGLGEISARLEQIVAALQATRTDFLQSSADHTQRLAGVDERLIRLERQMARLDAVEQQTTLCLAYINRIRSLWFYRLGRAAVVAVRRWLGANRTAPSPANLGTGFTPAAERDQAGRKAA